MTNITEKCEYLVRMADNALITGQRLAEWCGVGPVLEQDIALTNIALDHVGLARLLYQYAAETEGKGRTEDHLAFLRDAWDFRNILLVEQPKGDFAHTILRQFLYDVFNYWFYSALTKSRDKKLAALAAKTIKEITYHLRFSSEWTIRLGDGTEESHRRMQDALDNLWMYHAEPWMPDDVDRSMVQAGIGVDLEKIKPLGDEKMEEVLKAATLEKPASAWMQQGGKQGSHSEHLGHILSELQYLQRAYPGMEW